MDKVFVLASRFYWMRGSEMSYGIQKITAQGNKIFMNKRVKLWNNLSVSIKSIEGNFSPPPKNK